MNTPATPQSDTQTPTGTTEPPAQVSQVPPADSEAAESPTRLPEPVWHAIRRIRTEKGWTGIRLAAAIGIRQSALSRSELGLRAFTVEEVGVAAAALGVSVAVIYGEPPAPQPQLRPWTLDDLVTRVADRLPIDTSITINSRRTWQGSR